MIKSTRFVCFWLSVGVPDGFCTQSALLRCVFTKLLRFASGPVEKHIAETKALKKGLCAAAHCGAKTGPTRKDETQSFVKIKNVTIELQCGGGEHEECPDRRGDGDDKW